MNDPEESTGGGGIGGAGGNASTATLCDSPQVLEVTTTWNADCPIDGYTNDILWLYWSLENMSCSNPQSDYYGKKIGAYFVYCPLSTEARNGDLFSLESLGCHRQTYVGPNDYGGIDVDVPPGMLQIISFDGNTLVGALSIEDASICGNFSSEICNVKCGM